MYKHVVAVYWDKKYETHTYKPRDAQHGVNEFNFSGSFYDLSE
jgi:hypothetical protein